MINIKSFFLAILFLVICSLANAKHASLSFHGDGIHQLPRQGFIRNDLELLTGYDIDKRFWKHYVVGLNFQTRLDNNVSSFKAALAEASLRYDLNKFISFKTAFRQGWISVTETDWHGWDTGTTTGTQQRLLFATYLKLGKVDFPLHFQTRLRIENEWTQSALNKYTFVRARVKFKYNVAKCLTPYISAEPFWNLRSDMGLTLMRFEAGLQWHLGTVSSLHTFYRLETMKNFYNSKIHVIGLVWNLNFGPKQSALSEPIMQ